MVKIGEGPNLDMRVFRAKGLYGLFGAAPTH